MYGSGALKVGSRGNTGYREPNTTARWMIFAAWLVEVPRKQEQLAEEGFVWVVELGDYRKFPLDSIGQWGSSLMDQWEGVPESEPVRG